MLGSRPPEQNFAENAGLHPSLQGKDFADIAGFQASKLKVQGLESWVQASEFKVLGLESRAQGLKFRSQGFVVQGFEFNVRGLDSRVPG